MKVQASETGSGKLTVRELCEKLQGLPDDGVVRFHATNDQREGDIWSLVVEWDNSDASPVNVRHLHGGSRVGDSIRRGVKPPPIPEPTRFEGESERSFRKRLQQFMVEHPERYRREPEVHSYDQFNDTGLPPWQGGD